MSQNDRPAFNRARQLEDLWREIEDRVRVVTAPMQTWDGVRVRAVIRGHDDFRAATSLALAQLGSQALVQARSLTELAITIEYIARSPGDRVQQYADWFDFFSARLFKTEQLKDFWENMPQEDREEFQRKVLAIA